MKVTVVESTEVSGDANGVPGSNSIASGKTRLVGEIVSFVISSTIVPEADCVIIIGAVFGGGLGFDRGSGGGSGIEAMRALVCLPCFVRKSTLFSSMRCAEGLFVLPNPPLPRDVWGRLSVT